MKFQRRFCGIAAVLIAVAALGSAAARAQPAPTERITGEDGRYSIDMPRGYTSTTSPRPDGGSMRQLSYLWKDSVGQYNAVDFAIIDPPAGSTKQIDVWEAQRQLQARYPSSPLGQSREIQLGAAKGMSFALTVNSTRGQGVHVIAFKIYALEGRIYELMAETRLEDRDDPTVVAFMNALRIIR
jgi:hypothetical protein